MFFNYFSMIFINHWSACGFFLKFCVMTIFWTIHTQCINYSSFTKSHHSFHFKHYFAILPSSTFHGILRIPQHHPLNGLPKYPFCCVVSTLFLFMSSLIRLLFRYKKCLFHLCFHHFLQLHTESAQYEESQHGNLENIQAWIRNFDYQKLCICSVVIMAFINS